MPNVSLSDGKTTGPPGFNERFQTLQDMPTATAEQRVVRSRGIYELVQQFVAEAGRYTKIALAVALHLRF